ncbi:MAG: anthranilate synthase component I family protein, partial [Deltaproteobacteria bacterium]|nr:anthranilate synthase component I family protein [Deltaproteobacteria bacterium]
MIRAIHTTAIDPPALDGGIALPYSSLAGGCMIRSGEHAFKPEAQLFWPREPILCIHADQNGSYITTKKGVQRRFQGIWDALEWLSRELLISKFPAQFPVAAGYLSYELLHHIEEIPRPAHDPFQIPYYVFYLYRQVREYNESSQSTFLHTLDYGDLYEPFWRAEADESFVVAEKLEGGYNSIAADDIEEVLSEASNFTRHSYTRAVEDIRGRIERGLVYQVNLTQRFTLPFSGPPGYFFSCLDSIVPARYATYLNVSGLGHQQQFVVASSSPELFIYSDGGSLLTSPIKGSCMRGSDPDSDHQAIEALKSSVKDRAELAMIVDLARNDLGKVSEIGSVEVLEHARVDTLPYAHHLVSDVVSRRDGRFDLPSLIRAMFPCGSITGAPKIAAMEAISELEDAARGVYTGAVGYLGTGGACQFNVAIRTAVIKNSQLIFQTGGGIVFDSDAEIEYRESMFKAAGLYRAWKAASR